MPIQFIDFKGKPVKNVRKRFYISSKINAAEIIGTYFLIRLRIASLIPFAKGALFPLLAGLAFKQELPTVPIASLTVTGEVLRKNQPVL